MTSPSLPELKDLLRREALARRDALDGTWRVEASRRISGRVLEIPELTGLSPVGAYWPIRSEADPRPAMEALAASGAEVALPRVVHAHLSFRLWRPGDGLLKGGFGLQEPSEDAPEVLPTALLVPLAAFDREGGRIGYGKGYYDRAIAALSVHHPVLTIGLAYAVQEVGSVPAESHDHPLDAIITEAELIRTKP